MNDGIGKFFLFDPLPKADCGRAAKTLSRSSSDLRRRHTPPLASEYASLTVMLECLCTSRRICLELTKSSLFGILSMMIIVDRTAASLV